MMKKLLPWLPFLVFLLALVRALAVEANQRPVDEFKATVKLTSADPLDEGWFALNEDASIMAKPGTELYSFLVRHKGQKLVVSLKEEPERALERIER